jgi:hypothetical protein
MSAIKIILCVIVGVILANFITYIGYKYLIETNNYGLNKNLEISSKNQNGDIYSELRPPKINITLRNGSNNQLTCGNAKDEEFNGFLSLNGYEERNYENIDEGEYIGCNIKIDNRSSTILTWFHAISPGVYTLLLEQIECKTCTGTDHSWATIVVNPNGQREFQKI